MWIGHRIEIRKLTFRASALRQSGSVYKESSTLYDEYAYDPVTISKASETPFPVTLASDLTLWSLKRKNVKYMKNSLAKNGSIKESDCRHKES